MTTMSVKEFNQWATFYIWETEEKNKAIAIADAESKKKRNR